jgi:putative inorganic carbon (HCO3(-)) transporter
MRSSLILGEHETDPNQFAASLLLPFSLAFGVFLAARGRLVKMAVLAVLVSILFAIMLTMSRGGLLGVVVTLLVFLYRFRLKLGVIIPVAIGALLLSALPSLFFQRISGSVQDAGAGRAYIWIVGLAALEAYGVFGAGLGNFPVAFDQFAGSSPIPISSGNASHNIYLNTCVELGVIGLVLLVNALRTELSRRPIRKSLSLFHSAVACEAACWGILISGLFLDILWKKSFWLVWILLAAASRLQASPTEGSA